MYTCKECGETFMNFDDYQEHRLNHIQEENRQRQDRLEDMIKKAFAGLSGVFIQQAAQTLTTACLESGKSPEDAVKVYHQLLELLKES